MAETVKGEHTLESLVREQSVRVARVVGTEMGLI